MGHFSDMAAFDFETVCLTLKRNIFFFFFETKTEYSIKLKLAYNREQRGEEVTC